MEGLTIGRIVHYMGLNGWHNAAIISHVIDQESGTVNLMIFPAEPRIPEFAPAATPKMGIHYSETKEIGTWHWIEKA